jgi:hypothetical protein
MRDGAREMFDFPAPELPRKPRRKDLSAEEQEAADMEDEVAERKIKMKQNFALKLARDTAAYRASVADKLAGDVSLLAVLRALHEATPNFMRYM